MVINKKRIEGCFKQLFKQQWYGGMVTVFGLLFMLVHGSVYALPTTLGDNCMIERYTPRVNGVVRPGVLLYGVGYEKYFGIRFLTDYNGPQSAKEFASVLTWKPGEKKVCVYHSRPTSAPDTTCPDKSEADHTTNYIALLNTSTLKYCLWKFDVDKSVDPGEDVRTNISSATIGAEEPPEEEELEVTVVATDATASEEGQDPGEFTISRSGSTASDLTVKFNLGGTAENGVDYQAVGDSIVIPAGAQSAKLKITPIDDNNTAEQDETVILDLIDPVGNEAAAKYAAKSFSSRLAARAGPPATITIINHAAVVSQAIPTLHEWSLMLLSFLLFIAAWSYSRKRYL
jgi:hypothetical protein